MPVKDIIRSHVGADLRVCPRNHHRKGHRYRRRDKPLLYITPHVVIADSIRRSNLFASSPVIADSIRNRSNQLPTDCGSSPQ